MVYKKPPKKSCKGVEGWRREGCVGKGDGGCSSSSSSSYSYSHHPLLAINHRHLLLQAAPENPVKKRQTRIKIENAEYGLKKKKKGGGIEVRDEQRGRRYGRASGCTDVAARH